jgi:outer membrane protein OmpA-like peptidoglycan-associated protein
MRSSHRSRAGLALGCALALFAATRASAQNGNLAARSAGGHLVFFSSQYNESDWLADHLIDGSPDRGWAGRSSGAQAVTIAFADDGLAEVEDVLINPYTRENKTNWAKEVEIQVSATYPFRDFRSIGRFTLENEGVDQVFSFPSPERVRYLKILFLSNYGGGYMEAGEVKAMGRMLPDGPAAPAWTNLAAASEGARLETFTSEYNPADWAAANLIAPDGMTGWAGKSAGSQEVVVALKEASEVSDVAINNYAREATTNWAAVADVEISATSSYKGFQPVAHLEMPAVGELHTVHLAAPVAARYVKFIFRRNHGGGGYMEAARLYAFHTEPEAGQPAASAKLAEQLASTGRAVSHEINFATDSADILPSSESVLQEIADLLRQNADWQLIIEGHTDAMGGPEYNLELSRRRAEAVKRWLVDRAGIEELRLTTAGYGLTRPVASNDSEEGRAQNRRVELVRR